MGISIAYALMAASKRLIIGLGNPGTEYDRSRHNAGYMVVDAIAEKGRLSWEPDSARALIAWGRWRGNTYGIAKPLTFMNLSGQAVRALMRRYQLDKDEILVVFDDIHLPPGSIRLRKGGSAGGHNGVQDIIDKLGSRDFPRLRIGVGDNFARGRQVEYVLSPFSATELPLMEEAVMTAVEACMVFVREGLTIAMNHFNRR